MQLWRHVTRQRWVKVAVGVAAAEYLRFVGSTSSSVTLEPADIYERSEGDMPIIVAFWHGQHFLAPVARKTQHRVKVLVSRHHDGEMNAIAAERLGVGAIRGLNDYGFIGTATQDQHGSCPCQRAQRFGKGLSLGTVSVRGSAADDIDQLPYLMLPHVDDVSVDLVRGPATGHQFHQ